MKKLSIFLSTLFVGGILVFTSCSKTGSTGPAGSTGATGASGPPGPVLIGNISGNVIMSNEYAAPVTNAYTTGYILLKNATTNATVDSVIASSTGQYNINNVATGTYNMLCIYPGYGLNMHQNVEFTGGTLLVDNKITALPNFNVTTAVDSLGTSKRNVGNLYIGGTIPADNNGTRTILIFAGTSSSTSSNPSTFSFVTAKTIPQDSTSYNVTIALNTIYTNGFAYGNPVYFAVYGASDNYTYGAFTNFQYAQTVYTAISASAVPVTPVITLP
ncbi:MAG TPA: collagen-like protein [Bacteroidia bacterium]|jgi:hypothetical protein|nr:collagen-like protein [Bacteroidia bacterium]